MVNTKLAYEIITSSLLIARPVSALNQARNLGAGTSSHAYWLSVEDLDLGGCWKDQWTDYVKGLCHGCIRLNENKDALLWMFNKSIGMVNVKLSYELITSILLIARPVSALNLIWKCKIPLKLICFN